MLTLHHLALRVTVLVSLVGSSAYAIDTTPTWNAPELVRNTPDYFVNFAVYVGQNRYLAFDHYGEPGIAVAEQSLIIYARRVAGAGWLTTGSPIVNDLDFNVLVGQPALAFDAAEQPQIAYVTNTNANGFRVKLSRFDNLTSQWSIDQLWTAPLQTPDRMAVALAIDLLNRPAILFESVLIDQMEFLQDTDGDGNYENWAFGNPADPVIELALAYDPLNQPVVVDIRESGEMRFWVRPIGFSFFQEEFLANNARYPSIAVNAATGFPAIAYFDSAGQDLVYAEWDGSQWVFTTIDSTNSTGLYPSLAFDPGDDRPAIAYQDISDGDLNLAWFDGANWQIQTVVDQTIKVPTGYTPSLAFNEFGNGSPSIAYFDIAQDLYYIEDPPVVAGDLDDDGFVGITDFLLLLGVWGPCGGCSNCPSDLDGDCSVGIGDMLILLSNWT